MKQEKPHDTITSTPLTPSFGGRKCLGNGHWPGYECACDECDHFLTCFPEPASMLVEVRDGWKPILDEAVKQIRNIDPEAYIEAKEKFGVLNIWVGSTLDDVTVFDSIIQSAEEASRSVCEACGAPGCLRTDLGWIQTLCEACDDRYRHRHDHLQLRRQGGYADEI